MSGDRWALFLGAAFGCFLAVLLVRLVAWALPSIIPLRRAGVRAKLREHYRFITTLDGEARYGRLHALWWCFVQSRHLP